MRDESKLNISPRYSAVMVGFDCNTRKTKEMHIGKIYGYF